MLIIITGKSASGKSVLMKSLLLQLEDATIVKSLITRPPRPDDDSSEYEYISAETFRQLLKEEKFICWRKITQDKNRTDDLYGLKTDDIATAMQAHRHVIRSVTPQYIRPFHEKFADEVIFIHLLGANENEAKRRMKKRGGMTETQIDERISGELGWDEETIALCHDGIPIHLLPDNDMEDKINMALEIIMRNSN